MLMLLTLMFYLENVRKILRNVLPNKKLHKNIKKIINVKKWRMSRTKQLFSNHIIHVRKTINFRFITDSYLEMNMRKRK